MTRMLIGVDVGNSKTHVAVATPTGRVLAALAGPGASPEVLGAVGSWAVVDELITRAAHLAGVDVSRTAAVIDCGVAGLDFPEQETAFLAAAPTRGSANELAVRNDTFAVLRASDHRDGVAVVVGAGMNCVARLEHRLVRFAGLGALSGDWGGGIMLSEAAVGAAARAEDGRGPETMLTRRVPRLLGHDTVTDALRSVATGALRRLQLVDLARTVLELADAGDAVCLALVRRQAQGVADLVHAAFRRLGATAPDLPVVLGGGILGAGCRTLDGRLGTLLADGPSAGHPVLTTPGPPVVGSLLHAADRVAAPVGSARSLAEQLADRLGPGSSAR